MEIPLNRGHICSVLSKGILNGLRVKENDANYAFGRLFLVSGVNRTLRKQDRGWQTGNIWGGYRCWCSISAADWPTLFWPIKTCVISDPHTTPFKWPGLSGCIFLCFNSFSFWTHDCLSCFCFLVIKRYFGKLLIFFPFTTKNQPIKLRLLVLISGFNRRLLGRGEVLIWLRYFVLALLQWPDRFITIR